MGGKRAVDKTLSLFATEIPEAAAIKRVAIEFIYRHGLVQGLRIAAVVLNRLDAESVEIVAGVLDGDAAFVRVDDGYWRLKEKPPPRPGGHTQGKDH